MACNDIGIDDVIQRICEILFVLAFLTLMLIMILPVFAPTANEAKSTTKQDTEVILK